MCLQPSPPFQVYQERLTCLASGRPVSLRDGGSDGFVLEGAVETRLGSVADAIELLSVGEEFKRYAATAMNHRSSRA